MLEAIFNMVIISTFYSGIRNCYNEWKSEHSINWMGIAEILIAISYCIRYCKGELI